MCKCINSLTRIFSDLKIIKPDTTSGFFWHYKIFCVNAKYGILKRVPYFFIYNFVKCQRK